MSFEREIMNAEVFKKAVLKRFGIEAEIHEAKPDMTDELNQFIRDRYLEETKKQEADLLASLGLAKVYLVPVEVFGADECEKCEVPTGYGLCDVAEPGSDCNRAVGHIYRRDDSDQRYRNPEEVIRIYVPLSELPKFDKKFGDGFEGAS